MSLLLWQFWLWIMCYTCTVQCTYSVVFFLSLQLCVIRFYRTMLFQFWHWCTYASMYVPLSKLFRYFHIAFMCYECHDLITEAMNARKYFRKRERERERNRLFVWQDFISNELHYIFIGWFWQQHRAVLNLLLRNPKSHGFRLFYWRKINNVRMAVANMN